MYINRDDLLSRFGVQEIERLEANIRNQTATQTAIDVAVNSVNSYISVRYQLPLPFVSVDLQRACAIIARYYLYKDKPTETVRRDYEDVVVWLKDIASGKAVLPISNTEIQQTTHFNTGALVI